MTRAVGAILRARCIYIVGVRSSAALANYLNFYFRNIFENVRLVSSTATSEMFEQLLRVGHEDVVIGISLPRYSSRTVKLLQYAHDSGATVVTITDKPEAPAGKVGRLCSVRQEQHGLVRRLARRADERGQRADRLRRLAAGGQRGKNL